MSLEIRKCLFTNNNCYKKANKMNPNGIVVHSTGCNNPNLSRYLAPNDGIIGANSGNHWNMPGVPKCVHYMIGYDKNKKVRCYQTLPVNYKPYGCGSGRLGSYNNTRIQFEILEDNLTSKEYFNEAFSKAIKLCAYLCEKYNISYTAIQSHAEAYKNGYATNHGDCDHWLKKHGKNMDWFRKEVKKQIEEDKKVYMLVNTKSLNLRDNHSLESNILTILKEGVKVEYLNKSFNDGQRIWYKVKYSNKYGWVSSGKDGKLIVKLRT